LAQDNFSRLPQDVYRMVALVLLAELVRSLGDRERAAVLYQLLLPFRERSAVINCLVCTGSIARSLGVLATAMERWDDAEAHFEQALAVNKRLRSEAWVATTLADHARMLAARSQPGDRERALTLGLQALSTGEKLGMTRLAQEARALAELLDPGPASATTEGRSM
jgi:tetratricopeptide (TPR) repeat protein